MAFGGCGGGSLKIQTSFLSRDFGKRQEGELIIIKAIKSGYKSEISDHLKRVNTKGVMGGSFFFVSNLFV